ncbi:MAG: VWA domain-containing protein, partial [Planctomycetes bacterium]|nr:VWA domain-containing protein [Planctomycetota bacterium]
MAAVPAAGGGMTLASPWHLLALLVLPVLWWLSLPPPPRAVLWSPHLLQWRAALHAERRRPPRLHRLRFLLLAAAASAAAVAFAQPVLPRGDGARRLVVVLDQSASMAAAVGAHSADHTARERLAAAFASVPPHIDVTVLAAGGGVQRRHGASARALQDLPPPVGALDVDLAKLADRIATEPGTAVWTLTDGQGQAALPKTGALTVLPTRAPNAAITAVRVDDAWPLPGLRLHVTVVRHADAPGELRVRGACSEVAPLAVAGPRGEAMSIALDLQRTAAGGDVELRLAVPGDRHAADDTFVLTLPPLPAPRIVVRADAEAGPFAAAAAKALAREVAGSVVDADAGGAAGLLLVEGGQMALAPGQVRALTFGTRVAPGPEPAVWSGPTGIDWARDEPLTADLDLSELQVGTAW